MVDLDIFAQAGSCGKASSKIITGDTIFQRVDGLTSAGISKEFELSLRDTIEAEIIPRLISAHREKAAFNESVANGSSIATDELRQLEQTILFDGVDEALALVFSVSARGLQVEKIILDLLAPTAVRLGKKWEDEEIDFSAVSVALGRLQYVLHAISGTAVATACLRGPTHKVLLSAVPNESHIFSLLMVDQLFRGDGWDVWTMPDATACELTERVSREAFAIVGLSISCESLLPKLQQLIPEIRAASLNKDLKIMVGGSLFRGKPEYAFTLGADATADNGSAAVIAARRLVETRPAYYRG